MRKFFLLFPLLLPISVYGEEFSSSVINESEEILSCFSCSSSPATLLNIPWDKPSFQFWRVYYQNRWNRVKLIAQVERFKVFYPTIVRILKEEGLPEDLALLAIVESNGVPWAVSRAGAAGLWQLMPGTARRLGLKVNRFIDERFDVEKSTRAAARYLKELYNRFGRWDLAIAAYNAGPGRIEERLRKLGADEFWDLTKLPDETLNYVPKFYAVLSVVHGKNLLKARPSDVLIKLLVKSRTSLWAISRKLKAPYRRLVLYNRQFKKRVVPAGYAVYLPKSLVKNYSALRYFGGKEVYVYSPRKAEKLTKIAKVFGVSVPFLKEVNGLKRSVVFRGEVLLIVRALPEEVAGDGQS